MTVRVDGKYRPGADGSYTISLPELFGAGPGGFGGNYAQPFPGNFMTAVSKNFQNNWVGMSMAVIGIPIAVKVATKVLSKPVIRPANKLLKMTGLDVKL